MPVSRWNIGYRGRSTWVPYFVAVVALAVTVTASAYVNRVTLERDRSRYESLSKHTADAIERSIDSYIAMLHGTAGLFAARSEVTQGDLHAFVQRMEMPEPHAGVQGIGFAARVPEREREIFVERMRKAGISRFLPGVGGQPFDIWTDGGSREAGDQYPVIFLEKMDIRNWAAIGYDMFSDPVRREAMERARDTGAAAASGKVSLVQEIYDRKQAGFLIYVPIFRGGGIPSSVEQRRSLIAGFVYSPFRAEDLLDGVSGSGAEAGLDFAVYDGTVLRAGDRLYASKPASLLPAAAPTFTSERALDIAGRRWTVWFASNDRFELGGASSLTGLVAFWGALITLLLFAATRAQAKARAAAEDAAVGLRASEAALRLSETRTRRLFESSLIGIVYWHSSGRIVEANDAFLKMVQYSKEELEAGVLRWGELTPAEYGDSDARAGHVLGAEGLHPPYGKELFRKGGGRIPVLVGNARLDEAEGLNIGFVVDLTERHRAQQAERMSEQRLRLTADAVPAVISYIDKNECCRLTNRTFEEWFGVSPDRANGNPIREVLGDENYRVLQPHIRAALHGGAVEFEVRLVTPGHGTPDVHGACIPDVSPDGMVRGMVAFINDITDWKQAEEERGRLLLREREARSQAETLNKLGRSLSAELDMDRLVRGLADAARSLTGAELAAFLQADSPRPGASIAPETVSGDLKSGSASRWWSLVRRMDPLKNSIRKEDIARELYVESQEQPIRSFLWVPVRSRDGRVFGAVAVTHSEPARFTAGHERTLKGIAAHAAVALDNARLYRANEEARREAVAANRTKDEFLAVVSHELRTPLNAILGWAHLLRNGRLSPEQASRGIEILERNARSQAQLIGDLLDVSRIVSGKLRLEQDEISLRAVIEAAVETVAPDAAAKRVQLEKNLAQVGPVLGDHGRLQQVVWNLLSNAIKFTPTGGKVSVTLTHSAGEAAIHVTDTGAGIAPDLLPYIFDRFRQAENSSSVRHGGLGLGLAIVRHLVELHDGMVEATSRGEGEGAEFVVRIPLMSGHSRSVPHRPAALPQAAADAPLTGLRVMVVDDQEDARDLVSVALEDAGATVVAADSAQGALHQIGTFRPDVLVSDIGMPDEDGYALLEKVRSAGHKVPAVALTAFAREEDRRLALESGFQEHVTKPFDPERLISLIVKLAGRGPLSVQSASR